jgi:hypothetical protein
MTVEFPKPILYPFSTHIHDARLYSGKDKQGGSGAEIENSPFSRFPACRLLQTLKTPRSCFHLLARDQYPIPCARRCDRLFLSDTRSLLLMPQLFPVSHF